MKKSRLTFENAHRLLRGRQKSSKWLLKWNVSNKKTSKKERTFFNPLMHKIGPRGPNNYVFGNKFYSKMPKSSAPCIPPFYC